MCRRAIKTSHGTTIKHCPDRKYLGINISDERTLNEAIQVRKTLGRRKANTLLNISDIWIKFINEKNQNE